MTTKVSLLQSFDTCWAIYYPAAQGYLAMLEAIPVEATYLREQGQNRPAFEVIDGRAILHLSGPMMKGETSVSEALGVCSTVKMRRAIRAAVKDPGVREIVLVVDSPGGQVSGTPDLADEVAKATESKPVTAYIEGGCFSAALWVASQCSRVVASPYAKIGSIGAFAVLYDTSGNAELNGVKAHLFTSGGIKGQGSEGVPFSDDFLTEVQKAIDESCLMFVGAVAKGRGLSEDAVFSVADGRAFTPTEALALGLIDEIAAWDDWEAKGAMSTGAVAATETKNDMGAISDRVKSFFFGEPKAPTNAAQEQEALDTQIQALVESTVASHVRDRKESLFPGGLLDPASEAAFAQAYVALLEHDGGGEVKIEGAKVFTGEAVAAFEQILQAKASLMEKDRIPSAPTGSVAIPSVDDTQAKIEEAKVKARAEMVERDIENFKGSR